MLKECSDLELTVGPERFKRIMVSRSKLSYRQSTELKVNFVYTSNFFSLFRSQELSEMEKEDFKKLIRVDWKVKINRIIPGFRSLLNLKDVARSLLRSACKILAKIPTKTA